MSSDDIAIQVQDLGKCYQIYNAPRDRLKQFVLPRLQRLAKHTPQHYFREFWALRDVTFDVKKGESIGIIGRNGSGKSTLLQMIAGTLSSTCGSVDINGRVAALLELGSGFNSEFTGRENVFMNASVLGLSQEEITARFSEIAAFANIGDFIEQPVKTYSSGMLIRLAFAVSVCVEPDILIIDEALAVGDMAFQFKCLERLHQLIDHGTTLLFVSHDISLVRSFCDLTLLLDQGQAVAFGPSLEVTETYLMNARQEQMASSNRVVAVKPLIAEEGRFAFGTDQGRVVKMCFVGTDSVRALFSTGDVVCLEIEVEYAEYLKNPCISLIVLDRRMLVLSGGYFLLTGNSNKPDDHICRRRLTCRFELPFAPGEYFINIRLEDRMSDQLQVLIDKQVGALSFEILNAKNGPLWGGVLDLDMDFHEDNFSPGPMNLNTTLQSISLDEWFAFLCGDRSEPEMAEFVSDMPSEPIQMRFTGASGKATLMPAFDFYKLVLSYADKFHLDFKHSNILDFGCGWGRVIRFFVKDIGEGRLSGVDPLPEVIEICKATVKRADFYVNQPRPPISNFVPDSLDLAYAYSVFSHLNEEYTRLWFHEFHRILKRGGLLIVTTRSRSFIEQTALLRSSCENPDYARSSFQAFTDTERALADYDAGKFCHHPTGGGDLLSKDFFGETCIPNSFFVDSFSDIFNVEKFIDQLAYEPNQACVVLRKK